MFVLRLGSSGDVLDFETYGIGDNLELAGGFLRPVGDDGYIIAGHGPVGQQASDFIVFRLDADGEIRWQHSYGTTNAETLGDILITRDGGFLLGGSVVGPIAVRLNTAGDTLWMRDYFGVVGRGDIRSLIQLSDGTFIATGTHVIGEQEQILTMHLDSLGTLLAAQIIGGEGREMGRHVTIAPEGGWLISGTSNSFTAQIWDTYLVRQGANGDTIWTHFYGNGFYDVGEQAIVWPDSSMTILSLRGNGDSEYGPFLTRLDQSRQALWECGWWTFDDWFPDVAMDVDEDGRYTIAANSHRDCLRIIRTQTDPLSMGNSTPHEQTHETTRLSMRPFPNPMHSHFKAEVSVKSGGRLTLQLYNLLGQTVALHDENLDASGVHLISFGTGNLPSGTYFLHARFDGSDVVAKVTLVRQ